MTYIGQIELTKKKPPRVSTDERAWQDLYDTLNHLIDSVNSKTTTEMRRPGDLHNSVGDIRVFKDKTDSKYYMETMTEDGSARREMFISDKDNRIGDGFYSLAGKLEGGSGSSGSNDDRNIEQQLFEQIPWTGGIPNNITTDTDGKIVIDKVAGVTISNENIVQGNLVGSGKTWTVKPNNTTTDSDGKIVEDNVAGAIITNDKIVEANLVGSGKTFASGQKPNKTTFADGSTEGGFNFQLDGATAVGVNVFSSAERTKLDRLRLGRAPDSDSILISNGSIAIGDVVGGGKAFATNPLTVAQGKNFTFYQHQTNDGIPTALAEGDMWFDTENENKMYRYKGTVGTQSIVTSGNGWYIVNAVPTIDAIAINANQITAGAITAGQIATGTITATQINTANITSAVVTSTSVNATDINADNITAGTLTAAEINMDSGKARIETNGKVTTSNLVKIFSNDVGGARMGLRLIEHGDTSSADSGSTNWWQLFASTSPDNLVFNKGGSNVVEFTDAGLMIGDQGVGFATSGYNMQYDSGHIQVNLNAESTSGLSIYPNFHSTGVLVGHDLGKTDKKWRKIFVVQSNVGDLTMTNSDETAKWTLREQPDCILARNNITKKTFKLDMTETSDYADEEWDE